MSDISADQENVRRHRLDGLLSAVNGLDTAMLAAVRVSESCLGVEHTGRQNRALFVFAKMIAHNMSIAVLVDKAVSAPAQASLLDHFSVAALGRVSIDTAIMVLYLSEPALTLDQWNLRRHVLYLHDATSRRRFLSALAKAEEAEGKEHLEGYAEAKATLTKSIDQYGANLGLSNERLQEIKDGRVFVDGIRGAVREAGLSVELFDAHNAYLSQFVHGYPVSFIRADAHAISFDEPSEYQKYLSSYVMTAVSDYTEAATARMKEFCGSAAKDPLGQVD